MALKQDKKKTIEDLAKVLVSSKHYEVDFGSRIRSKREGRSHPMIPVFPVVNVEHTTFYDSEGFAAERQEFERLLKDSGLSYIHDMEPVGSARVVILPALDPELEDIEKAALLVKEIKHQVWLIEQKTMLSAEPDDSGVLK